MRFGLLYTPSLSGSKVKECLSFFAAEFPKVFEENGPARVINGFETKEPLPFQLQMVGIYKGEYVDSFIQRHTKSV